MRTRYATTRRSFVERERARESDPQARRIGVVIDSFAEIFVDLSATRARIADDAKLRAVGIGRLSADEEAVDVETNRANGVGQRRGKQRHLPAVQDIDVGIAREELGIDGEEKATRLELIVFDGAID